LIGLSERYNTQQRAAILAFFAAHPDECFSARDIIDEPQIRVGEATVYRLLGRLADEGAVTRYAGDAGRGSTYRYSDDRNCVKHVHLKCTTCGSFIHFDCPRLNDFTQHIELEHEFNIDSGKTVIYGLCKHCK
jgi:Fur family ferric uptake transcriptional regulator